MFFSHTKPPTRRACWRASWHDGILKWNLPLVWRFWRLFWHVGWHMFRPLIDVTSDVICSDIWADAFWHKDRETYWTWSHTISYICMTVLTSVQTIYNLRPTRGCPRGGGANTKLQGVTEGLGEGESQSLCWAPGSRITPEPTQPSLGASFLDMFFYISKKLEVDNRRCKKIRSGQ